MFYEPLERDFSGGFLFDTIKWLCNDKSEEVGMTKWWPFGKKKAEVDEVGLFQQAEAQLRRQIQQAQADGLSAQAVLAWLKQEAEVLAQEERTPASKAMVRAYDLLYEELHPQLMQSVSDGRAYEMAGQVAEAVRCYETAVTDQVATRFPYEHLRVIYVREKQYAEALRICQMAMKNPFLSEKDQAHFAQWVSRLQS